VYIYKALKDWALRDRRRLHLLSLLFLAFACRAPYGAADLAHFTLDDNVLIVLNPSIRDFGSLSTVLASGRPIRGISLMVDYALFGMDPRGYHLENLLWHFLCTALFYALVFRITRRTGLAVAAAGIFAVHSVHPEVVMAITHRKEMLAFFFMLLSYHAWLYRDKKPAVSFALTLLFFFLGALAKQVVLALPLLFAAHAWLEGRLFAGKRSILFVALLAALGALLLAGGSLVGGPLLRDFNVFGIVSPLDLKDQGYARILATSFSVYTRHLGFLFLPVHHNVAPDIPVASWAGPGAWLGLCAFLGLMAAAFTLRKRFLLSYSLFWMFITILPIMNWIPSNAFFAERYLYIPSAGACLLAAGLLARLYETEAEATGLRGFSVFSFLLTFFLGLLLFTNLLSSAMEVLWPASRLYRTDRALAALYTAPLMAAVAAVAVSGFRTGPLGEALGKRPVAEFLVIYAVSFVLIMASVVLMEFLLRHRLWLPEVDVHQKADKLETWLGMHARPGPRKFDTFLFPTGSAPAHWRNILLFPVGLVAVSLFMALRFQRYAGSGGLNRSIALQLLLLLMLTMDLSANMRSGDWASELRLWSSSIQENPENMAAWNNLGKAYMDRRRYDLAAQSFEKAARLAPQEARIRQNLATARLMQGNLDAAARSYRKAIELDRMDIISLRNLANIMVTKAARGEDPEGYKKAIPYYLRVLELDPRSAHAYNNLAFSYYSMGAFEDAERAAIKALSIEPSHAKARALLQKIREERERE